MPEVPQYVFTHHEVIEALIKAAGVHEGQWILMFQMGMTAGQVGPPTDRNPGVTIMIQKVGIQRAPAGSTPANSVMVDAAKVNPVGAEEETHESKHEDGADSLTG